MSTNQRKWEDNYFWGNGNNSTIFKGPKNGYIQNLKEIKINKSSEQKLILKLERKEGAYKTILSRTRIYSKILKSIAL